MNRSTRYGAFALLLAFPVLALARPPLIYHKVAEAAAHPGGTVKLVLSSHDVVVNVKAGDKVRVTTDIWASADSKDEKSRIIDRYAPTVESSGDNVRVQSPSHHGWHFSWGRSPQARVTVVMPADMKLDYRLGSGDFHFDNPSAKMDIKGESGSGDVYFKGDPGRLHLSAGSGDMRVATGADSGPVSAHTGSGDIDFSGGATSLSLGAGSGDVTINDAMAKSAELGSGSGDVVAHWNKLASGASIKSSSGSGDVIMYFPSSTVIGGKISTGSGDVNTDFPAMIHGSHHSYTLAGGAGAITVDLDTGSGDISLHKGG
ncbi:MAG: DUF4097 family beta strand repeat-containing protein [Gammaproteobacteria bacterium]